MLLQEAVPGEEAACSVVAGGLLRVALVLLVVLEGSPRAWAGAQGVWEGAHLRTIGRRKRVPQDKRTESTVHNGQQIAQVTAHVFVQMLPLSNGRRDAGSSCSLEFAPLQPTPRPDTFPSRIAHHQHRRQTAGNRTRRTRR